MMRGLLSALVVALGAAGCASLEQPFQAHLDSGSAEVRECAQWYRGLDDMVDAAGVRDAQHSRVPGFPYLRVNRILASLHDRAAARETAMQAWTERMLELELESRRYELDNLPPDLGSFTPKEALRRAGSCGRLLREVDLARPQAREALFAGAKVPDDYSSASRAFGLYPLTRIPFASGVRKWQEETAAVFARPAGEALASVRYAPPGTPLPRPAVAAILARAAFDPLGLPSPTERELERIAATYAPSFEIAIGADYDRFGQLRWRRGASLPEVDAAELAVYVHAGYTRYHEQILLQLAYTIWFPERPPQGAVDLLAGRLDALVWRVTLAPDGEPLLYDSMHACGCYHMFFPTPRAAARPAPDSLEEWAFVPLELPRVAEGERPIVTVASATHYVEGVRLARGADSLARYAFHDYNGLRSMRDFSGGARSAFGPDGLIAGSERSERFLFWPMGIASAGAMRQWGRHATAFVGRRHFDDADLIERRFALDLRP